MKIFHCHHCDQLVFFESFACVRCRRQLAYLPDLGGMSSLEKAGANWQTIGPGTKTRRYRLCANYRQYNVCNWAVPSDDPNPLCISCRLTRIIPNLNVPGHREAWQRLEIAKRRLVYTLLDLNLPVLCKTADPVRGLGFEFLAETAAAGAQPVRTGHDHGIITIDIKEADDVEREKHRVSLHEPYRTLLGHFCHEAGHYYWARLIEGSDRLEHFRRLFGDERADYGQALRKYYDAGPPPDWQQRFVSAYATAHPWEDWAETWAHYLHMTDALDTAAACGLSLRPRRTDEPSLQPGGANDSGNFERMIENWFSLTYVLNNLSRGLGEPDAYPFVLSPPAIEKLHLVNEAVRSATPSGAKAG